MKKITEFIFLWNAFISFISFHVVVAILFALSDGMELEAGFRHLAGAVGVFLLTGFWAYLYKDIVK